MPLFSIIIPTYKSEATIKNCLNSIISQSFGDWEIVLQDGISDDKTIEYVKEFSDDRIRFYSEKDLGVYDAMNKAIKKTNGTWIYFLGSDDYLYDNEVLNNVFRRIQNVDTRIVYGNVLINGDCEWAKDGSFYDGVFSLRKILQKNICHQSMFFKKSIFHDYGYFNTSYKIESDWDYNLKLYSKESFFYIPETISVFNTGGLSSGKRDAIFQKEFSQNIFSYFKTQLYRSDFDYFVKDFLYYGKSEFNKGRMIGMYFFSLYFLVRLRNLYHKLVAFGKK